MPDCSQILLAHRVPLLLPVPTLQNRVQMKGMRGLSVDSTPEDIVVPVLQKTVVSKPQIRDLQMLWDLRISPFQGRTQALACPQLSEMNSD